MKISYAQEMELCKSLLTAHGMNADDAGLLGESVAHSDFTASIPTGSPALRTTSSALKTEP